MPVYAKDHVDPSDESLLVCTVCDLLVGVPSSGYAAGRLCPRCEKVPLQNETAITVHALFRSDPDTQRLAV